MDLQRRTEIGSKAEWFSRLLDLLYPPVCVLCSEVLEHGKALCDGCAADLPQVVEPFCERCGEGFEGRIDGHFSCPNCHALKFSFEFARPAMFRDERTLEMIHRLKYGRQIHLARELGGLACLAFEDERLAEALAGKWPLVPVPLHWMRRQHRHFNQADEIAKAVGAQMGLPVLTALRRTRATTTQTLLVRAKRLENLRGAFSITRNGLRWIEQAPEGGILVDDVLTTGSTVEACAKVLRQAGFQKVVVITVMRG